MRTVRLFQPGEVITAAMWNEDIKANLRAVSAEPERPTDAGTPGAIATVAAVAAAAGASQARVSRRQLFGLSWLKGFRASHK
jgi:hypothetical protein